MIRNAMILLVVLGVAYWWWQRDAFHRRALALAREGAVRSGSRLLDDSVSLIRTRLRRNSSGWCVERVYIFEVTATGGERFSGQVVFLGVRVLSVDLNFSEPLVL